jgi:hypothetical protein
MDTPGSPQRARRTRRRAHRAARLLIPGTTPPPVAQPLPHAPPRSRYHMRSSGPGPGNAAIEHTQRRAHCLDSAAATSSALDGSCAPAPAVAPATSPPSPLPAATVTACAGAAPRLSGRGTAAHQGRAEPAAADAHTSLGRSGCRPLGTVTQPQLRAHLAGKDAADGAHETWVVHDQKRRGRLHVHGVTAGRSHDVDGRKLLLGPAPACVCIHLISGSASVSFQTLI